MEYNTPCITSLDTTNAVLQVLKRIINKKETDIYALDDYSHNRAKEVGIQQRATSGRPYAGNTCIAKRCVPVS